MDFAMEAVVEHGVRPSFPGILITWGTQKAIIELDGLPPLTSQAPVVLHITFLTEDPVTSTGCGCSRELSSFYRVSAS